MRPASSAEQQEDPTEEGTRDYWIVMMLETPNIWAWRERHDTRIMSSIWSKAN